jgi:hypothetical protein
MAQPERDLKNLLQIVARRRVGGCDVLDRGSGSTMSILQSGLKKSLD